MKHVAKMTPKQQKIAHTIINSLVVKKEIKVRFQNGEDLRVIAKEKGFEVVLPL